MAKHNDLNLKKKAKGNGEKKRDYIMRFEVS